MQKKNTKTLIMLMPSIEEGGVEKNFLIISNFLAQKLGKLTLITISKNQKKNLKNLLNLFLYLRMFGINLEGKLNIY